MLPWSYFTFAVVLDFSLGPLAILSSLCVIVATPKNTWHYIFFSSILPSSTCRRGIYLAILLANITKIKVTTMKFNRVGANFSHHPTLLYSHLLPLFFLLLPHSQTYNWILPESVPIINKLFKGIILSVVKLPAIDLTRATVGVTAACLHKNV